MLTNREGLESVARLVTGPREESTAFTLLNRNIIKSTSKDFIIPIDKCISHCSLENFLFSVDVNEDRDFQKSSTCR